MKHILLALVCLAAALAACTSKDHSEAGEGIIVTGAYPYVTEYKGTYYYMMQTDSKDTMKLWATTDLDHIDKGRSKAVLTPANNRLQDFWSPELHRINGKWYIYFEGDDGNTDIHQLYCLENPSGTSAFTRQPLLSASASTCYGQDGRSDASRPKHNASSLPRWKIRGH